MKVIHVVAFLLGIALAQDSDNPSDNDGSILNDLIPAGHNPGGNNPAGNNPGGNPSNNGVSILDGILPSGNNPDGNNPAGNNPAGNNPGALPSTSGGGILGGILPGGNNPAGNNPAGNNPGALPSNNGGGNLNTDALCPSGIYSNAQCCSDEEQGLQRVGCEAPSTTPSDVASLRSICAEAGKAARCCVDPIAGQDVLCTNA